MSVMVPVIFILSIGFYGIPGALGSDANPLITEVDYNGNTNDPGDIGSNDTTTQETDDENLDQDNIQSSENGASNTGSNTGTNTRPNPDPVDPVDPVDPGPEIWKGS